MLRARVFLAEDTSQTCQLIASIELEDWKWTALQQTEISQLKAAHWHLYYLHLTRPDGPGWSETRRNIHPLLPQPINTSAVSLSHHPGKEGDHRHPDALCYRKASSWAKCSANKQRRCFYLVLTEETVSWPSAQVRRAWQALAREETWWGQERFPSSRLFCPLTLKQTDFFDHGGVTLIYLKVSGSRIQPNKLYQFMGFTYERKGSPDSRSLGLLWWPTVKVCILLCVPLVWW